MVDDVMGEHFFKSLKIENFRGIKSLEISDLARVNIFVGKNGCGKTSILESALLLADFAKPHNIFGGNNVLRKLVVTNSSDIRDYFYEQNHEQAIIFSAQQEKNSRYVEITASSKLGPITQDVEREGKNTPTLDGPDRADRLTGFNWDFSVSGKKGRASAHLKEVGNTDVDIELQEGYQETLHGLCTTKDFLYDTKCVDELLNKKLKDPIVEAMKNVEPRIQDIRTQHNLVEDIRKQQHLVKVDIGLGRFLPINLVGDGIMKILSVISTIMTLHPKGLLMIDEVETGLHVSSIKTLWKVILEQSKKCDVQLFLTSHSKDILEGLKEVLDESEKESVACFWVKKYEEDNYHKAYRYSADALARAMEIDIDPRH